MTLATLLYFLTASMALTIAPGPDNIFVVTQGIARGRKPAIVTALGMVSGVSVHTAAAALGVSAIFYSSAVAFGVLKLAGAAYLLFLAYKTVKNRSAITFGTPDERPASALFKRGFLMNVLNPKVAMFFLAFLPQFAAPGAPRFALHMMLLGAIFMAQAAVIFSLIGWFSGSIGEFVVSRPKIKAYFDWLTAGVFTALGLRLAFAQR